MPDLIDELSTLHRDALAPASDTDVAADLRRGRLALRRRRVRRGATTVFTGGLVAVVAVVGFGVGTGGDASRTPTGSGDHAVTTAPGTAGAPAVDLVAWKGDQLEGFTVDYVPAGYVLQGVSDSVLDIARAGDTTSLDVFEGKLVVMLTDQPTTPNGNPVTINGHQGYYARSDDATVLTYDDGTHDVVIQAWNDLGLDRLQLIAFAEGVTVTAAAVEGHG